MKAKEELSHNALRIKELEEACAHLETELAAHRLRGEELTVRVSWRCSLCLRQIGG